MADALTHVYRYCTLNAQVLHCAHTHTRRGMVLTAYGIDLSGRAPKLYSTSVLNMKNHDSSPPQAKKIFGYVTDVTDRF